MSFPHSLHFHKLYFSHSIWAHFVHDLETQVGENQRKLKLNICVECFIKKEKKQEPSKLDQKDVYLKAWSYSVRKSNYVLISVVFGKYKRN